MTQAALVNALRRYLDPASLIFPGEASYEDYTRDEGHGDPGHPALVVCVGAEEEMATVLRLASEFGVCVTPRGAGSGKVGGAVPQDGSLVLSTERLNKIIDIDPANDQAVVEPGAITAHLDKSAAEHGLFYPPDPASLEYCSLGGNVATNAGGPRAYKYGVTGSYLLGARVYTANGACLFLGRQTRKGVSGYNLLPTLVGSEGTLAVLGRLHLRLIPRPLRTATLLAGFSSTQSAAHAATSLTTRGLTPSAMELLDPHTFAAAQKLEPSLPRDTAATLLIELDGEDDDYVESSAIRAGQYCEQRGALFVKLANSALGARAMWRARRGISRALKRAHPHKFSEDVCVARSHIPQLFAFLDQLAAESGVDCAGYGHAGDGNIHVNFLPSAPLPPPVQNQLLKRLFAKTIALGGTLSGEHGIGTAKQPFMALEHNPAQLALFRQLKALWDPHNILNPGKILPLTTTC